MTKGNSASRDQEQLLVSIVVNGSNVMGEPLCELHAVHLKGRKTDRLDYSGPIGVGAAQLLQELKDLFAS